MRLNHPRLILILSPTQLDAAIVVGKRVRATKRVKISPMLWEEAWGDGLTPFDSTLATLLKSLSAPRNVRTSVLYSSPGSIAVVKTAPGPGEDGVEAARLEVVESNSNSGLEYISGATRLDHVEGANVIVTADRDLNAQTIFAWLSRAGCRLEALIPERAITLRSVINDVVSREDDGSVTCYLGERTTVIASGGGGVLTSIRSIDFGFSLLVEAFARGLRQELEEGGAADVCSNHAEARKRLFELGLPTSSSTGVNAETFRSVIPLLQPVIQRYCIEVKQTIRFGIPETGSPSRRLRLTGPGAAIHGFKDPLSHSIDLDIYTDPLWAEFDPGAVCDERSTAMEYIREDAPQLRLTPRIVREQNASRQIASGVRTGVLCAGLALAAEGGYIFTKSSDAARAVRAAEPALVLVREHRSQCELASALAVSLDAAATQTLERMGDRPDWYALLGELASLGSESISLSEIRAFREDGRLQVIVIGYARLRDEQGNALGALTERLRSSPLFGDVQLGSTSLVENAGERARRFELRLSPHLFPPDVPAIDVSYTQSAEATP